VKPYSVKQRAIAMAVVVTTAMATATSCSKPRHDRADVARPPVVAVSTTTTSVETTTTMSAPTLDLSTAKVSLEKVATFDSPVTIATRQGDESVYVGERVGRVQRLQPDGTAAVALDITSLVKAENERGLLGLTFSSDHAYVHYSNTDGDTTIDEFTVDAAGILLPDSRRHVFGQQQPYANHNGGQIEFGPDGFLYVGLGDGGSANDPERRADKLDSLLGKILRIDPRATGDAPYAVPADNPFVNREGARPEIWHYGLRNPWRFSFDQDGALWIGDVGQGDIEEVDMVPPGQRGVNFGWSAFEGSKRFNEDVPAAADAVAPIHEYEHGDGSGKGCSVTGGYRYRGTALVGLYGAYVFADYCVVGVRAFDPANPKVSVELTTDGEHVTAFGQANNGELYVASLDGPVYRLT
jgi:glucose/arabinose dehydrogenase